MELTEQVESINRQLIDLYGIDTSSGQPIFKVVFSEEEFEKRLGTYDDFTRSGIYIRTVTEVREVPKYNQWIKEKYVLERLVIIPDINLPEFTHEKLSYEPLWIFQDNNSHYLPPRLDAAKLVIDTMYAALGKSSIAKYVEDGVDNPIEHKASRIKKLQQELFGNESDLGDALAYKTGVGYTGPIRSNES